MQRFKLLHRTYYNYSSEVMLGAHSLRLRPRENHELRIETMKLSITPTANLLWHRDIEGNSVATATFSTPITQLVVESEAIIQQYNETPLDFLVADEAVHYPFQYRDADQMVLAPYMTLPDPETSELIKQWIGNIWQENEAIQTYTLLRRLTSYIYENYAYQLREEPGVQTATQTLSLKTGSCRDFAALFMCAASCLGLASRFVSGYLYAPLLAEMAGATHAWAEVYIPGAGWKGFDPTIGKIVGPDHIMVAVARLPESVPPIAGSFSGTAKSSLTVGVWVSQIDS